VEDKLRIEYDAYEHHKRFEEFRSDKKDIIIAIAR
jgi:hypothetical protein